MTFDGRRERDTAAVTAGVNVDSSSVSVYLRPGSAIANVNLSTTGAISSADTLFTLPAGYWPAALIFGDLVRVSDSVPIRVHVLVDGTVQTQAALASGQVLRGQFTVPI